MKRLLTAFAVAVALHVLLFQTSPGWLRSQTSQNQPRPSLAVTLSYVQSAEPEIKTISPESSVVREEKRPVVKEKKKKRKLTKENPQQQKKKTSPQKVIEAARDIPRKNEVKKEPAPAAPELTQDNSSTITEETADFAAADLQAFSKEHGISRPVEKSAAGPPEDVKESPGPSLKDKGITSKDAMPLYKLNPRPDYPRVARRRGYEGTVVLSVFVTHEGKVGDIEIDESSGYPVLDRSALRAVKEWRFVPAIKKGSKVDMWVKVPVTYRLR